MSFLEAFKAITTFAFDVDGVLTDGSILVFENGEQVRTMNIKDGYALQLAVKKGYRVVILSGANAEGVKIRLNKLGITDVFMQVSDKKEAMEHYLKEHQLSWKEVLFMGDDVPDQEVMQKAAISCAPKDAVSSIRQNAQYISPYKGGQGCVRDVLEKVLKLKGHWAHDISIASK
jgi:3-deoxy-D-manno-octulosonate 8-phosphate phosphatase (KDO 8-P phosphatase)